MTHYRDFRGGNITIFFFNLKVYLERFISFCSKNVSNNFSVNIKFCVSKMNTYFYMIFRKYFQRNKCTATLNVLELSFFWHCIVYKQLVMPKRWRIWKKMKIIFFWHFKSKWDTGCRKVLTFCWRPKKL